MKKGQMAIIGMLMVVLSLITFAYIYPVLHEILENSTANMSSDVATIISLSPLFLVIMIILSAFWYVIPQREVYR